MARRPVWLTDQEVALLFALVTGQPPVGGSHVGTAAALARLAEPWLTVTDDGTVVRLVSTCSVCGGSGRLQSWECVRCSGTGDSSSSVALYRAEVLAEPGVDPPAARST